MEWVCGGSGGGRCHPPRAPWSWFAALVAGAVHVAARRGSLRVGRCCAVRSSRSRLHVALPWPQLGPARERGGLGWMGGVCVGAGGAGMHSWVCRPTLGVSALLHPDLIPEIKHHPHTTLVYHIPYQSINNQIKTIYQFYTSKRRTLPSRPLIETSQSEGHGFHPARPLEKSQFEGHGFHPSGPLVKSQSEGHGFHPSVRYAIRGSRVPPPHAH